VTEAKVRAMKRSHDTIAKVGADSPIEHGGSARRRCRGALRFRESRAVVDLEAAVCSHQRHAPLGDCGDRPEWVDAKARRNGRAVPDVEVLPNLGAGIDLKS